MEVLAVKVEAVQDGLTELKQRVDELEKHNNKTDLDTLRMWTEMREMFIQVVEDGTQKLRADITTMFLKLEGRVDTLEKEKDARLKKEAEQIVEGRKQTFKLILSAAISVVITFLVTSVLNNYVTIG